MLQRFLHAIASLALLLVAGHAQASISLSGTRLIYEAKDQGATIIVHNGTGDVLVQSWVEGNNPDDTGDVPFAVTPPLTSLPANKQQLLRVIYSGDAKLPADRESVFWLNVQEIPQTAAGENVLQIAIRQRIKIFFRPSQLIGDSESAPNELQWQITNGEDGKPALQVTNPSAYHVSMADLTLDGSSSKEVLAASHMVPPGEKSQFPLKALSPDAATELNFRSINDYGGSDYFVARIDKSASSVSAKKAPQPVTPPAAKP